MRRTSPSRRSFEGSEQWKVHFNSKLGLNGTFGRNPETGQFENMYDTANDVVTPGTLDEKVDQFTIAFERVEGGAHMVLSWITTGPSRRRH